MQDNVKYRSLPVHMVNTPSGIVFRRGTSAYFVEDKDVGVALYETLEDLSEKPHSRTEFINRIGDFNTEFQGDLFDRLASWRFIVPVDQAYGSVTSETPEDIYYWENGSTKQDFYMTLKNQHLTVIGVNSISLKMMEFLDQIGHEHYQWVSSESLDETISETRPGTRIISSDEYLSAPTGDSNQRIIAVSANGNFRSLRNWNSFAVFHRIPFFPILLYRFTGYIGPFVIPCELPCYECVYRRLLSNLDDPDSEIMLHESVAAGDPVTAYHPVMAELIAQYSIFEINKVFSTVNKASTIGRIIEIKPEKAILNSRKVLKAPLCPVCGPEHIIPSTSILKTFLNRKPDA